MRVLRFYLFARRRRIAKTPVRFVDNASQLGCARGVLAPATSGSRRFSLSRDFSGIHGFAGAGHCLIEEFVAVDFDQHEGAIFIETCLHHVAAAKIVVYQLSRIALYEVVDSVLRLDSLVGMLVPGENRVDAV